MARKRHKQARATAKKPAPKKNAEKKPAKSTARTPAKKADDEKLFLKLLQSESKTPRKTPVTKRGTKRLPPDTKQPTKGKQGKPGTDKKRTQPIPKTGAKIPVDVSKVRKRASAGTAKKGTSKTPTGKLVAEKRQRGKEQNDFHFEGVRSVDKKIDLFKAQAKDAIKKQLARRGGRPPRGIIVTVRDKKGREHTRMSDLTFVVNAENVQNFVDEMLADMKADFMEWKDMEGEPGDDTDENPYKDFNPDNIAEITIKYIY
jgi:hypothetical protein